jgi:hypothetical protein
MTYQSESHLEPVKEDLMAAAKANSMENHLLGGHDLVQWMESSLLQLNRTNLESAMDMMMEGSFLGMETILQWMFCNHNHSSIYQSALRCCHSFGDETCRSRTQRLCSQFQFVLIRTLPT